jgi:hypothetical protein
MNIIGIMLLISSALFASEALASQAAAFDYCKITGKVLSVNKRVAPPNGVRESVTYTDVTVELQSRSVHKADSNMPTVCTGIAVPFSEVYQLDNSERAPAIGSFISAETHIEGDEFWFGNVLRNISAK